MTLIKRHIPDGTHGNINVYRDKPGVIARSERGNRHVGFAPRTGLLVGSVFPDRFIVTNPEKLVVEEVYEPLYLEYDLKIDSLYDILLNIDGVVYHPSFEWEYTPYGLFFEGPTRFVVFANNDPYIYVILELPCNDTNEILESGKCALYSGSESTIKLHYEKSKNFVTFPFLTFPADLYLDQGAEYETTLVTTKSLVVIANGEVIESKWSRKPPDPPQYTHARWECTHQYGRIVLECDKDKKIPSKGGLTSYKNSVCEIQLTSRT